MEQKLRLKLEAGASHCGSPEEHFSGHQALASFPVTATLSGPTGSSHEVVTYHDDGTHRMVYTLRRCSRATAHRRRRAVRLMLRGYRLAGGSISPPGLQKEDTEAAGDLGGRQEDRVQKPPTEHEPNRGEDLELPAPGCEDKELTGAAPGAVAATRPSSAPPAWGRDEGAEVDPESQEGFDTGSGDSGTGEEDEDELTLYEITVVGARTLICELRPGIYTGESIYNMVMDNNPMLEDMMYGDSEQMTFEIGMVHTAFRHSIETSVREGYLENGGRNAQGEITCRRTDRRAGRRRISSSDDFG